jgi:hypothetical protein
MSWCFGTTSADRRPSRSSTLSGKRRARLDAIKALRVYINGPLRAG